ncbi:MAG: hypothetical protein WAO76_00355 [Georgfuchsia sp.]
MAALGIEKSSCTKNLQHLREVKKQIYKCAWKKEGTGMIPLYDIGHKTEPDGTLPGKAPAYSGKPKVCACCGKSFPETLEYFGARKQLKNGLDTHCKDCRSKKNIEANHKRYPHIQRDEVVTVPVERTEIGKGRTLVRFGAGWKAAPAQRVGSSWGFSSPLSNTMEAPG